MHRGSARRSLGSDVPETELSGEEGEATDNRKRSADTFSFGELVRLDGQQEVGTGVVPSGRT